MPIWRRLPASISCAPTRTVSPPARTSSCPGTAPGTSRPRPRWSRTRMLAACWCTRGPSGRRTSFSRPISGATPIRTRPGISPARSAPSGTPGLTATSPTTRTSGPAAAARLGSKPLLLEVVVHSEVGDLLLAHHPAQRVAELRLLDEQVVLGIEAGRDLRGLEVEAEPLLDAAEPGPPGQVEEQAQVEGERRGEDRVAAHEVD